jgi:hypothetical protein
MYFFSIATSFLHLSRNRHQARNRARVRGGLKASNNIPESDYLYLVVNCLALGNEGATWRWRYLKIQ